MKIGIYSPYLDTLTGGEKYIFTAASCLSKEHEVTIFWDDPSIVARAEAKFGLDLQKVQLKKNVFSKNTGLFQRIVSTLVYDRIIYLSDGSIPVVGAKKLLIHFQFPVEWVNTNSFIFLFKKSRISKIICNSYFTKQYIDAKFNTKSYILYPPVDQDDALSSSKENLILTVGRFSILSNGTDFKKLKFLVDAFKQFQKKRLKGWKLAIVTSVRPDLEEDFAKFEKSIKNRYVTIYKNARHDEIISLYKKSKIYWHAAGYGEDLIRHPERAEHFGISTAEAMSHGAVPIVINAGGQPEIVKEGDNGFLWEKEDALLEKTHKIAVDKNLYLQLSEKATETARRFTVERFCEELNHLIW